MESIQDLDLQLLFEISDRDHLATKNSSLEIGNNLIFDFAIDLMEMHSFLSIMLQFSTKLFAKRNEINQSFTIIQF